MFKAPFPILIISEYSIYLTRGGNIYQLSGSLRYGGYLSREWSSTAKSDWAAYFLDIGGVIHSAADNERYFGLTIRTISLLK